MSLKGIYTAGTLAFAAAGLAACGDSDAVKKLQDAQSQQAKVGTALGIQVASLEAQIAKLRAETENFKTGIAAALADRRMVIVKDPATAPHEFFAGCGVTSKFDGVNVDTKDISIDISGEMVRVIFQRMQALATELAFESYAQSDFKIHLTSRKTRDHIKASMDDIWKNEEAFIGSYRYTLKGDKEQGPVIYYRHVVPTVINDAIAMVEGYRAHKLKKPHDKCEARAIGE